MSVCTNCQLPIETKNESNKLCAYCEKINKKEIPIRLAPIDHDDLELILAWRSNPQIYQYFRNQNEPIDWEDHVSWFESRVSDRYDFMINYQRRRVGVINIDQNNMVGIYLGDFSAHGQGIATEALSWLCNRFEDRSPLFAEIHKDNTASKNLFYRCGFRQVDQNEKWIEYVYDS
jgi:RimJ/RimL family protein N-acetyltransferase